MNGVSPQQAARPALLRPAPSELIPFRADEIVLVPVHSIVPDPDQPRCWFDEGSLASLARDIQAEGLLSPLIVLPARDGIYPLVAGERRRRAALLAGLEELPCLVRDLNPGQVRRVQLVENLAREGLSGIERARGILLAREAMEGAGVGTWEEVGQMAGLKRTQLHQLRTLLSLPANIITLLEQRRLSASHGVELARLNDHPEIQQELAEARCCPVGGAGGRSYGVSVRQLRARVTAALGGPPTGRPSLDLLCDQLERSLRDGVQAGREERLAALSDRLQRALESAPADVGQRCEHSSPCSDV